MRKDKEQLAKFRSLINLTKGTVMDYESELAHSVWKRLLSFVKSEDGMKFVIIEVVDYVNAIRKDYPPLLIKAVDMFIEANDKKQFDTDKIHKQFRKLAGFESYEGYVFDSDERLQEIMAIGYSDCLSNSDRSEMKSYIEGRDHLYECNERLKNAVDRYIEQKSKTVSENESKNNNSEANEMWKKFKELAGFDDEEWVTEDNDYRLIEVVKTVFPEADEMGTYGLKEFVNGNLELYKEDMNIGAIVNTYIQSKTRESVAEGSLGKEYTIKVYKQFKELAGFRYDEEVDDCRDHRLVKAVQTTYPETERDLILVKDTSRIMRYVNDCPKLYLEDSTLKRFVDTYIQSKTKESAIATSYKDLSEEERIGYEARKKEEEKVVEGGSGEFCQGKKIGCKDGLMSNVKNIDKVTKNAMEQVKKDIVNRGMEQQIDEAIRQIALDEVYRKIEGLCNGGFNIDRDLGFEFCKAKVLDILKSYSKPQTVFDRHLEKVKEREEFEKDEKAYMEKHDSEPLDDHPLNNLDSLKEFYEAIVDLEGRVTSLEKGK